MSVITDYTERLRNAGVPVLGHLCWYSVSDTTVKHKALVQALYKTGLNEFLPRLPLDADVFRRTCSNTGRRKVPTGNPDVFRNFLIRDVGYDSTYIYKRVVAEDVDQKGRALDYSEEVRVDFDKNTGTIKVAWVDGALQYQESLDLAEHIGKVYTAHRGTLDSYAVRELIRRVLLRNHATNVRGGGGGVYFVSHDHTDHVLALEQLAALIPGDVMVHSLPLVDDTKQREMLKRAFESESIDEIDKVIVEITELRQKPNPKLSKEKYAQYHEMFRSLQAKAKEYTQLLDSSMDVTHARLRVFQRSVMELSTLVQYDK